MIQPSHLKLLKAMGRKICEGSLKEISFYAIRMSEAVI
jgi:hypothetical protein